MRSAATMADAYPRVNIRRVGGIFLLTAKFPAARRCRGPLAVVAVGVGVRVRTSKIGNTADSIPLPVH